MSIKEFVQSDVYPKYFGYITKLEGYPNWFGYTTLSEMLCLRKTKRMGEKTLKLKRCL